MSHLPAVLLALAVILVPSSAQTVTVPNSPSTLPGRGLAQHPFLYCGEWNFNEPEQTMWIVRDGKPIWSYAIPFKVMFNNKADIAELGDCTLLSNGNVVFSTRLGAAEVTPQKRIVWQMFTPIGTELHSIQPIGLDHVLVAQNGNPAKLLLINTATNTIEKTVVISVGKPGMVHGQLRRPRMTSAGTFLVAHMDNDKVAEYDDAGKEIWSYTTPEPWAAVRLKNGNTLITGNHAGYVKEVSAKGELVWSVDRRDLPGYTIGFIQDVQRLANGDTVFSNWIPNTLKPEDWKTSVQLIEVTPAKKIVWALREWGAPPLGPASGLQMLDEVGVPEAGGLER